MKRTLLFSIAVLFAIGSMAQARLPIPASIKNLVAKKPIYVPLEYENTQNQALPIPQLPHSKTVTPNWVEIGNTYYDLQSNASADHRTYLYGDGCIGTTWTMSQTAATSGWADRGTGYNYYNPAYTNPNDGGHWLDEPTTRVESVRCGWGSYSHLGASNAGEIIVAHSGGANGMVMSRRTPRGSGTWTQSYIPVPAGSVAASSALWPRVCTSGDTIYIICSGDTSSSTATGFGGQKAPIYFYRSIDGGATWDKAGVPIPAIDNSYCHQGFGGDIYAWATPKGQTIAFVVGENWTDLLLLKSTDAGNTWTKTTIFQHPYPCWTDAVLTPDTPYVADGDQAVELDASGKAHVVFGIMRVLNDVANDGQTSYFPGTDGMAYWVEGDATLTNIKPAHLDSLVPSKLVAWVVDRNGNGTVFENYTTSTTFPAYYCSLSSMPQLNIDANGDMFLTYKSVCEDMLSSSTTQYYSHIWGRSFLHTDTDWGQIWEVTNGSDFDQQECVFPTTSKTSDANLHLTFQMDPEPGLMVRGDLDGVYLNSIIALDFAKADLSITKVNTVNLSNNEVNIYPNPVSDNMNVSFNMNKSNVKMTILNLVGSTVMSQQFVSEKGETKVINVSNLSTGIYLAKFETAKGTFTQKIMKQ